MLSFPGAGGEATALVSGHKEYISTDTTETRSRSVGSSHGTAECTSEYNE